MVKTFSKFFVKSILKLFYRVEVKGMEHYKAAGKRVVIISNHLSFLDGLLIAGFVPDKPIMIIHSLWFNNIFKQIARFAPIDQNSSFIIKQIVKKIKNDDKCVIFPEGRLSSTGCMMKAYPGAYKIAKLADANILPIYIYGVQFTKFARFKPRSKRRKLPKIVINIHESIKPSSIESSNKDIGSQILQELMSSSKFKSANLEMNLWEALLYRRKFLHAKAVVIEDEQRKPLTISKLIKNAINLSYDIEQRSKSKEVIGILLANSCIAMVNFFAMQAVARVPCMLDCNKDHDEILANCIAAGLNKVYTSEEFIKSNHLAALVEKLEQAGITILYLEKAQTKRKNTIRRKHKYKILPDEPAVVLFTKNPENKSRGVVLSHKNILANINQMSSVIDFNSNDTVFNAMPISSAFGLNTGTLLAILSGMKVFLYPQQLHYKLIPELIYDIEASILFSTNNLLENYAKHAHSYDFRSLRYVFSWGEKLQQSTFTTWSELYGIKIFDSYGCTETASIIALNTALFNKKDTVGKILPGIKLELQEKDSSLIVSGPNLMLGYLSDKKIVSLKQAYNTGDTVEIDSEGYVTINAREQD